MTNGKARAWVAIKQLNLSYHNSKTMSFGVYIIYININAYIYIYTDLPVMVPRSKLGAELEHEEGHPETFGEGAEEPGVASEEPGVAQAPSRGYLEALGT